MNVSPLKKAEIIKAIKYQNPSRVPLLIHYWRYGAKTPAFKAGLEEVLKEFPCDFAWKYPVMPGYEASTLEGNPGYRWLRTDKTYSENQALDSKIYMQEWDNLDEILKNFPDPNSPGVFRKEDIEAAKNRGDLYLVCHHPYFLYERLWTFRGVENTLTDFYLYPDEVKRILRALCDFYKVIIRRSKEELNADAYFITDDMGGQQSLMFPPKVFLEFLKPLYREVADECHKNGMHFWLHCDGNITEIFDDLIDVGVDVIHPIQKYAMDPEPISKKYSGKICFWAGIDMQDILKSGSMEDVRKETRNLVNYFDSPKGGLMLGAGNGITDDIPLDNIRAFLDEALNYGIKHRQK
jgi:uroporphyrinogen decarboxylase